MCVCTWRGQKISLTASQEQTKYSQEMLTRPPGQSSLGEKLNCGKCIRQRDGRTVAWTSTRGQVLSSYNIWVRRWYFIVEEWKTNLMSLAILFHFLCAQHVSDINISIIGSFSLQNEHHPNPAAPNLQHTTNWEQDDRCGNSTTQSQTPDDGYINVRNMLST